MHYVFYSKLKLWDLIKLPHTQNFNRSTVSNLHLSWTWLDAKKSTVKPPIGWSQNAIPIVIASARWRLTWLLASLPSLSISLQGPAEPVPATLSTTRLCGCADTHLLDWNQWGDKQPVKHWGFETTLVENKWWFIPETLKTLIPIYLLDTLLWCPLAGPFSTIDPSLSRSSLNFWHCRGYKKPFMIGQMSLFYYSLSTMIESVFVYVQHQLDGFYPSINVI
jgi:hypothetical protein